MKKYTQQQKKCYKRNYFCVCLVFLALLTSCSNEGRVEPVIIWTNRSEISAAVELFNLNSEYSKAVVVYKENPAASFAKVRKEAVPDIVIGSWLNNLSVEDNFLPINYLFEDQLVSKSQFYPQLLEYGSRRDQLYLLPVSFNLPLMIYSASNEGMMSTENTITVDQIKELSSNFNKTSKDRYVAMGYAPSWQPEFMYEVAKINGADFVQSADNSLLFSWNQENLQKSVDYFIDWTSTVNTSTEQEGNYNYKYLPNPVLNNLNSERSLFSYMSSNELFVYPEEKLDSIRFKWLHKDGKQLIHDEMLTMGLYRYSDNVARAEEFIIWFMNAENQKDLIQWTNSMNLYTKTFGVAGGFSAIRSVNERQLPAVYPSLWGNLPLQENIIAPNYLPSYWENVKEQVLIPFLQDATVSPKKEDVESVQSRVDKVYRYEY